MSDGLRRTPFNRALYRANMIWGGERKLMMFALLVSCGHIVTSFTTVGIVSGVLTGILSVFGLRAMAKKDPQMSEVYLRNIEYQEYYPPFSRPYRTGKTLTRLMKGTGAY